MTAFFLALLFTLFSALRVGLISRAQSGPAAMVSFVTAFIGAVIVRDLVHHGDLASLVFLSAGAFVGTVLGTEIWGAIWRR